MLPGLRLPSTWNMEEGAYEPHPEGCICAGSTPWGGVGERTVRTGVKPQDAWTKADRSHQELPVFLLGREELWVWLKEGS